MPIHDWTRVEAGIFHDFHVNFLAAIRSRLNDGLLPSDYYALAEQVTGPYGPDVVTLQIPMVPDEPMSGGTTTLTRPVTRVRRSFAVEPARPPQRRIAIRHVSGDQVIAVIEVVSPGNKSGWQAFQAFIGKSVDCLRAGIHLLIVDLFPPTERDPYGLPTAIGVGLGDPNPLAELPQDEPLSISAFIATESPEALIEPMAIGRPVPTMPLYLTPTVYVMVPLDDLYQTAYHGVPRRFKQVLDASPPQT